MRRLCERMFVYVMSVILKESHWLSVIYVLCISGGQSVQVIYGGGGGCFISLKGEPLLSPQMPVNIDWAPLISPQPQNVRYIFWNISSFLHCVTWYLTLPSSARTRTTPAWVWHLTSGESGPASVSVGVTQESLRRLQSVVRRQAVRRHGDMTQWGVTTSVTPVIRLWWNNIAWPGKNTRIRINLCFGFPSVLNCYPLIQAISFFINSVFMCRYKRARNWKKLTSQSPKSHVRSGCGPNS